MYLNFETDEICNFFLIFEVILFSLLYMKIACACAPWVACEIINLEIIKL